MFHWFFSGSIFSFDFLSLIFAIPYSYSHFILQKYYWSFDISKFSLIFFCCNKLFVTCEYTTYFKNQLPLNILKHFCEKDMRCSGIRYLPDIVIVFVSFSSPLPVLFSTSVPHRCSIRELIFGFIYFDVFQNTVPHRKINQTITSLYS